MACQIADPTLFMDAGGSNPEYWHCNFIGRTRMPHIFNTHQPTTSAHSGR